MVLRLPIHIWMTARHAKNPHGCERGWERKKCFMSRSLCAKLHIDIDIAARLTELIRGKTFIWLKQTRMKYRLVSTASRWKRSKYMMNKSVKIDRCVNRSEKRGMRWVYAKIKLNKLDRNFNTIYWNCIAFLYSLGIVNRMRSSSHYGLLLFRCRHHTERIYCVPIEKNAI